jgi:hypothetical protein
VTPPRLRRHYLQVMAELLPGRGRGLAVFAAAVAGDNGGGGGGAVDAAELVGGGARCAQPGLGLHWLSGEQELAELAELASEAAGLRLVARAELPAAGARPLWGNTLLAFAKP